eukprot:COSAG01_NODE_29488_length_636_cov_1.156425_2_plen_75_part_01
MPLGKHSGALVDPGPEQEHSGVGAAPREASVSFSPRHPTSSASVATLRVFCLGAMLCGVFLLCFVLLLLPLSLSL